MNPRPRYHKDRLRDDGLWQWKWHNDRLYELEEMMPYMEAKGYQWISIDKPKFRGDEVVYWFVGVKPKKVHHSVASQIPMGWYTLGEIMDGKPYEDALERGRELNRQQNSKDKRKYRASRAKPKTRKKRKKT